MRIVTWNVNSVRARFERLMALLARLEPDVLCLQELKVVDEAFPFEALKAAGYQAAAFGQKTYNGVAIISRQPIENVVRGFGDNVTDDHARFIAATVGGVRVASAYFPNGGEVGGPRYPYKLEWMGRLRGWLDRNVRVDEPFALTGDFNVAPDDLDIQNPGRWRPTVLAHDEVRNALANIANFGLVDVFRRHHPDGHIYSWWDYRMLGFPKNDGLRIDHIFTTPLLAARSTAALIDREERKGKSASDHAPVSADFS